MKVSIAVSVLILAIAAVFGWRDHQHLVTVRESHRQLVEEASTLGISLDPENPTKRVRITKHGREDSDRDARLAAAEFIAFAKEMEAMEQNREQPDDKMQERIMEVMDRMMSLSAAQLKIVIAEVKNSTELKDDTRRGIIGFSIMTLASDHPQAALAIFTESSDIFEDAGMGKHVISSSLANWAKDDPMGALEWVRKNSEKHPKLVTDDAKRGILSGAASQNPKLAFKLIAELDLASKSSEESKFPDPGQFVREITRAAKTPEERTATLAALREHLSTLTDPKSREKIAISGIASLGSSAAEEGFEAGSKWITDANFSPKELESITSSMAHNIKPDETGQWVEWIGANLPAEQSRSSINRMVERWTREDYNAAGTWLAGTPDGPAKVNSVRSYAETVSSYDPETAAQWALTLPAGKDRNETLKQIHRNWPENDPATQEAKKAFAKQHGLDH